MVAGAGAGAAGAAGAGAAAAAAASVAKGPTWKMIAFRMNALARYITQKEGQQALFRRPQADVIVRTGSISQDNSVRLQETTFRPNSSFMGRATRARSMPLPAKRNSQIIYVKSHYINII